MAKNDFQYGGWNFYTSQCGTIMTLILPGDCTLQCGMWLWEHDSEFTKWQHPAMWYVALGWHAIEFAQTFAILEFHIWFKFRPYHSSRHVILHQSAKFYPNRISANLDFSGPIMGSLKSLWRTSYWSSWSTIALNFFSFWENCVFLYFGDRQTDGQHRCTKPLSLSRGGLIITIYKVICVSARKTQNCAFILHMF